MNIKLTSLTTLLLSLMLTTIFVVPSSFAAEEIAPSFTVSRFLVSEAIADREPVGVTNTFSADTEKAYCFLEARDIIAPTEVNFVWYYQEEEVARVTLALGQSARWRTYSSKNIANFIGAWKVEVVDINGTILDSVDFTVE